MVYTYTQFSQISQTVFAAGQIGLDPARMVLVDLIDQPSLSLTHTRTVLKACHAHLNSALCGMCYFTTEEAAWRAREAWSQVMENWGYTIKYIASFPFSIPEVSMCLSLGMGPENETKVLDTRASMHIRAIGSKFQCCQRLGFYPDI